MIFAHDEKADRRRKLYMEIMGILVQYRYGADRESTEYYADLIMKLLKDEKKK